MSELGYVVVEYGPYAMTPDLTFAATLYPRLEDAQADADVENGEAEAAGRPETFRVARVELVEEDETDA